jgi:hypothetical protein
MQRHTIIAGIVASVPAALATSIVAQPVARPVSIVQLLATPEKFDGKFVQVCGFLRIEFEDNAVYLHREDHEHWITSNALWVDIPHKTDPNLSDHYVLIQGTFNASDHGHMDVFAGAIHKSTRLIPWH